MAGPYDSVVTIGGQSFVDGIWRLLGPALEGITNPLPLALPGFANARMRVTQIVPVFPAPGPATGALNLFATVEVTAEALLHVTTSTKSVNIALGPQDLSLASLTGSVELPARNGTLTNILLSGGALNLGPGTGDVQLPPSTAALSDGSAAGTLDFPGDLAMPALPFPAVVPVAVELTPSEPLALPARAVLSVFGPDSATRFSLLFRVSDVDVGPVGGVDPNLAATLTATLQYAVDRIVAQLAIPDALPQPMVDEAAIADLIAPIPALVAAAFDDALTRLLAETGRLLFPPAGTGASCDAKVLPTSAEAMLTATPNGSYRLQIGFKRAGGGDIQAFPAATFSPGMVDSNLIVGNSLLLNLMCCLVERLPAFVLPVPATTGTTDMRGANHLKCCNFTGVTATFGAVSIGGGSSDGISVCIDGNSGSPKVFSLVGRFSQKIEGQIPVIGTNFTIASVDAGFALPIGFDLDDVASIANLRTIEGAKISAGVTLGFGFAFLLIIIFGLVAAIGGWIAGIVISILSPVAAITILLLVYVACRVASYLLRNAVRTLLSGASLLRSPVAVPPGLFEAFGRFSPATVTVDDLIADGVLHTPTSPWALLPRFGSRRTDSPDVGNGSVTHL
jgi:hypothetical protein